MEWLRDRSPRAAEAFWRDRLVGFRSPNRIASGIHEPSHAESRALSRELPRAITGTLQTVARACRVPAALVLEVLWAAVVAGRTRSRDVVCGATVSGRPASVPGIDRMVGCFVNTVPVRVQFSARHTLRERLVVHHRQRVDQSEFEYCSAGQIQSWSEAPPTEALYQSVLVYENAPAGTASGAGDVSPGGAARVHGARTAYPLTLIVSPGATLHVRAVCQPDRIALDTADALVRDLERLLSVAGDALDRPVDELVESVPPLDLPDAPAGHAARVPFVAPRTRIEHEIARVWESLFHRAPIGVLDDFFALGGHSLMALQLGARLRDELGLDLPVHALVADTTIERLAARWRERAEGHDEETVIPLASGGAGVPVYCFHPLGGHVLCYVPLARALAGRHPCVGLQAKGLRAGDPPPLSWDDVVEHHWAHLGRSTGAAATGAPVDRVAFVGYSYGGYIAVAMAERARREGARHVPVILIDTPHPSVVPARAQPTAGVLLQALFYQLDDLDPVQLDAMADEERVSYVHGRAVAARLLPAGISAAHLHHLLGVAQSHARLAPPSRRAPFPVTLVRAAGGAARLSDAPDLGWEAHTEGVTLEWVSGRHETMLDRDHAGGVAEVVARVLRASS
jgi:thioesterase domain-containing protein